MCPKTEKPAKCRLGASLRDDGVKGACHTATVPPGLLCLLHSRFAVHLTPMRAVSGTPPSVTGRPRRCLQGRAGDIPCPVPRLCSDRRQIHSIPPVSHLPTALWGDDPAYLSVFIAFTIIVYKNSISQKKPSVKGFFCFYRILVPLRCQRRQKDRKKRDPRSISGNRGMKGSFSDQPNLDPFLQNTGDGGRGGVCVLFVKRL